MQSLNDWILTLEKEHGSRQVSGFDHYEMAVRNKSTQKVLFLNPIWWFIATNQGGIKKLLPLSVWWVEWQVELSQYPQRLGFPKKL